MTGSTNLKEPASKGEVRNPSGHGGRAAALAREHLDDAVGTLAEVAGDRGEDSVARVEAAKFLIALGRGRV